MQNDDENKISTASAMKDEREELTQILPDPSELTPGEEIKIGTVLDGTYKIISQLGRGGMGAVFLGKHIAMDRQVAIKVLFGQALRDTQAVLRFQNEARALALLQHPKITVCLAFGVAHGQPYMVMEHVEGRSLAAELKAKGPLEVHRVLEITRQIADALAFAHQRGVIHRDIKPSNIMLCAENDSLTNTQGDDKTKNKVSDNIKVLDFGIAKLTPESGLNKQKLTLTGEFIGTLTYVSPEQCNFEAVDQRSDIFSLGVLSYELLAGSPPFQAENALLLIKKITSEEAAPIKRKLDRKVLQWLNHCLAKNPKERYQNMEELLKDLEIIAGNKDTLQSNEDTQLIQRDKVGKESASLFQIRVVLILVAIAIFGTIVAYYAKPHSSEKGAAHVQKTMTMTDRRRLVQSLREKAFIAFNEATPVTQGAAPNSDKLKMAINAYTEALQVLEECKPQISDDGKQIAILHFALGHCFTALEQFSNAAEQYDKALSLKDSKEMSDLNNFLNQASSYLYIAAFRCNGDLQKEEKVLDTAIELYKRKTRTQEDELILAELYCKKANNLNDLKGVKGTTTPPVNIINVKQEDAYQNAMKIFDAFPGKGSPIMIGSALIWLNGAETNQNKPEKAEISKQRILKLVGRDSKLDAIIATWINSKLNEKDANHRVKETELYLDKLLSIAKVSPQFFSPAQIAQILGKQGSLFLNSGDYDRAEQKLKSAIDLLQKQHDASSDELARMYDCLAQVYLKQSKRTEAARVITLLKQSPASSAREITTRLNLQLNSK